MPKGLFIPKNVFFALKISCLPYPQNKKSAALQSHDYRTTGNKQKKEKCKMKISLYIHLVIFP